MSDERLWTPVEMQQLSNSLERYMLEHKEETPYGPGTNFLLECCVEALKQAGAQLGAPRR